MRDKTGMAEDGDGEDGSGGDPRMKLLELYSLKTLKQVCTYKLYGTRALLTCVVFVLCAERRQMEQNDRSGRESCDDQ